MHINLLHKILNLAIDYKEFNYLLKQKHFDSKILQDKLYSVKNYSYFFETIL